MSQDRTGASDAATWIIAALIVLAPLPLGGDPPRAASAITVTTFLALGLRTWMYGARRIHDDIAPLALPLGLLVGFTALQLMPLPPALLGLLSPSLAADLDALLPTPGRWWPLSIDPESTWMAWTRLLACLALALVVASASERGRRTLLTAVVLAGSLVAGIAWLHRALGWEASLFGVYPMPGLTRSALHWPFGNPNHFGLLVAMAWPVGLGLAADGVRLGRGFGYRVLLPILGSTLALSAVIASESRSNLFASVAAGAVLLTLWPLKSRRAAHAARLGATIGAVLGLLALVNLTWNTSTPSHDVPVEVRADQSYWTRLTVARLAGAAITDHAIAGSGLGTWEGLFPHYAHFPLARNEVWDHAHNEYVQGALELGITGGLLVIGLAFRWIAARRGRTRSSTIRAGLTAAFVAALVHSVFDYGLRIPANAALFAAVLGLLWQERTDRRTGPALSPDRDPRPGNGGRVWNALAIATLTTVLLWLGTAEWREEERSDRIARSVEPVESSATWRNASQASWESRRGLEERIDLVLFTLQRAPFHCPAHRFLAALLRSSAEREAALRRAIVCDPGDPNARLTLARAQLDRGLWDEPLALVEEAFQHDPRARMPNWIMLRDPRTGRRPLLDAAERGIRTHLTNWPSLATRLTEELP